MYNSRLLTLLSGNRTYADAFDVTPARLVPVVGSLAVSGGALKAAVSLWLAVSG